jgi:hypothetical protein
MEEHPDDDKYRELYDKYVGAYEELTGETYEKE